MEAFHGIVKVLMVSPGTGFPVRTGQLVQPVVSSVASNYPTQFCVKFRSTEIGRFGIGRLELEDLKFGFPASDPVPQILIDFRAR